MTWCTKTAEVIRFLKRGEELGFTVDDAEELLFLTRGYPADSETTRSLAAAHLTDLNQRIADLVRMRDALQRLVSRAGNR